MKALGIAGGRIVSKLPVNSVIAKAVIKIGKNSRRVLAKYLSNRIVNAPIVQKISAIVLAGIAEGSTESLQEVWNNTITKLGIDKSQDLLEGIVEAFIGGFGGGGVALVGQSFYRKSQAKKNLKRKIADFKKVLDAVEADGVDLDQFTLAVEKGMVNKYKEVDKAVDTEVGDNMTFLNEMKQAERQDIEEAKVLKESPAKEVSVAQKTIKDVFDKRLQREIETLEKTEGRRVSILDKAKLEIINIDATIQAIKEIPEFNVYGVNIFEGKQELLKRLRDEKRFQKDKISKLQEEQVIKTVTKALKEKLQNIERGIRKGKVLAKEEIKAVQDEAIKIFKDAKLPVPISIRNIKTQKQLEKAMPVIKERVAKLEQRVEKNELARQIERLEKVDVPQDYRDQIDELLEGVELKRRTEKTKKAREKRQEFLERQQAEGDLTFLPKDFFDNLPKKTIDDLTVEELEIMRDAISVLVQVGRTKKRLLSKKYDKEINTFVNDLVQSAYNKVGLAENLVDVEGLQKTDRLSNLQRSKEFIDGFFAAHRKVEFIMKFLDGLELTQLIHEGRKTNMQLKETYYTQLGDAFLKLGNLKNFMKDKGLHGLTREQMVGVALNAGNRGNIERLLRGNKLTQKQIEEIKENLTDKEKVFVEDVFKIIEGLFPEMSAVTQRMTGLRAVKIDGRYFPIVADYKLSKRAELLEAQRDLFQDIFQQTYLAHSFSMQRIGGKDAVNLNVIDVITRHIDGVIHYISFAEGVRDAQKVINSPRFRNMIETLYNEATYKQFPDWLKTIANPKANKVRGPLAAVEQIAKYLRHNATTAMLGIRLTVSLIQAGSYTQTIKEIGAKEAFSALSEFLNDKKGTTEFVFENSILMKNRARTFDRDIKDKIARGDFRHLTKKGKSYDEMLFYMIQSVDMMTTIPTWIGAYNLKYAATRNKQDSIDYADHVVRTTQPTGLDENLASVMKGPEFIKIWTSFMSHFANVHNQITLALDELKMGKEHPLRRIGNFARSMWFVWLLPAFLTGFIKNLGDLKRTLRDIITYPFGGLLWFRDAVNMIKGFEMGAPPALRGIVELQKAVRSKDLKKGLTRAIKGVGIITGKIPTQAIDSIGGAADIITGESDNWMRLFFSDYLIKGSKTKNKSRD